MALIEISIDAVAIYSSDSNLPPEDSLRIKDQNSVP